MLSGTCILILPRWLPHELYINYYLCHWKTEYQNKRMNIFKRAYIWCKRIRYRRGYGVHSPFAFNLITDVFYEQRPYYAYDTLKAVRKSANPALPCYTQRIDKLLFRLANYFCPEYVMEVGTGAGVSLCYIAAGRCNARCTTLCGADVDKTVEDIVDRCKNATLLPGNEIEVVKQELLLNSSIDLLHLAHTDNYREVFELCLPYVKPNTLFIIQGINDNAEKKAWWQSIVVDKRTGITFDLYYVGLVFFNMKMNKQHYVVNF